MSKRANLEGSVFQTASGMWRGAIQTGNQGGKRKRVYVSAKTQREALQKIREIKRSLDQGVKVDGPRTLLSLWSDCWLENQKHSLRAKSYTSYEYQLRQHIKPALGHLSLGRVQPQPIREFLRQKLEGGLSATTVNHFRVTLKVLLNAAVHDGMIARNPIVAVKPIRAPKRQPQVLDLDQAQIFMQSLQGGRLRALYLAAVGLGLREGEILGLRWCDVDLEEGSLHVRHALQRVRLPGEANTRLHLVEPKSKRSRRKLFMPAVVRSALAGHKLQQDAERCHAGDAWVDTDFVFATQIGTPLDPRNLLKDFKLKLVSAGLPEMRFHDLRHSAASLLVSQGADPRIVMETLGHSQISITMDLYGHVFESVKRGTAELMDRALTPPRLSTAPDPVAADLAAKTTETKPN